MKTTLIITKGEMIEKLERIRKAYEESGNEEQAYRYEQRIEKIRDSKTWKDEKTLIR